MGKKKAKGNAAGGISLEKLLERFKAGNRTLGIIGRFRSEDEVDLRRHVFVNTEANEDGGTLGADELFRVLKPELRATAEGTIQVGGAIFNSYDLGTPLNMEAGEPQPILIDSPLLSDDAYTEPVAKQIQSQGAKLYKKLLGNLHVLAQFWDSKFPKAILKIAQNYLLRYANEELAKDPKTKTKQLLSPAEWSDLVASEHGLTSTLVKYLTCHRQDESDALSQVRAAITEAVESRKANVTNRQIDLLVTGLERCKESLLTEREYKNDPILAHLAPLDGFRFLHDYPADKEYGLTGVEGVHDKRFLSHFAWYIQVSDDVHRFVRTKALHSYLFCWLASKYRAHDDQNDSAVPKQMYDVGVEGQGDKRIPAESREERAEKNRLIDEAEPELSELPAGDNYADSQELNVANLKEVLSASRLFTTKELKKRLQRLFARIAQIAGGKAGRLLKENADFNVGYVKFYRSILNTREQEGKSFDLELFRTRLLKLCVKPKQPNSDDESAFVEAVIKGVNTKDKPKQAELRRRVKESFIRRFAVKSKTRFARQWLNNESQIDAEEKLFLNLYDFRLGLEVAGGDVAGMAGPVVTAETLSIPDIDNDQKTARQESLSREALAGRGAGPLGPPSVEIGRPLALADRQPEEEAEIKSGSKTIGKLKIVDEGKAIATLNSAKSAPALTDPRTTYVFKTGRKKKYTPEELGPIPQYDELIRTEEEEATGPTPTKYERLSETQDSIRRKYMDRVEPQQDLNRSLRAMLFGEYILAAPSSSVNLDKADLSCILGLMIDMVEHLGDRRYGEKLYANAPTPELDAQLKRLNLSLYYPVANSKELTEVVTYHYELCKKLNSVSGYLREVGELKRFFEAVKGSDLRIVLINDTVANHLEEAEDNSSLIVAKDSPAVVYLTDQADANSDALNELAKRTASAVDVTKGCEHTRVPILVASDSKIDPATVPLPLICPKNTPLPKLVMSPVKPVEGSKPAKEQKLNADELIATQVVQQSPYLLLCAGLLSPDSDFGSAGAAIGEAIKKWTKANLGVRVSNEETLTGYFRKTWFEAHPGILFSNFVLATWLNVAILGKRVRTDWVLCNNFAKPLHELFSNPKYPTVQRDVFAGLTRGDDPLTLEALPIYVLSQDGSGEIDAVENQDGQNHQLDAIGGTRPIGDAPLQFDGVDWAAEFQQLLAEFGY